MSLSEFIDKLERESNLRSIPEEFGPEMVDMTSNDYLGLAHDNTLVMEFLDRQRHLNSPMTSSASRLLAGRQKSYRNLEQHLEKLYGRPALLFNSGYHANTGIVSALASLPDTLVVADRLVHASIIDGIVLSRAPFKRFRHNDFAHLEKIVAAERGKWTRILIIAESIYSMDGDNADIDCLTEIKKTVPEALIYIDEAHAVGVEGPGGLGLTMKSAHPYDVDIIVGTFGKALASSGAFCIADSEIIKFLVNRSRSLIFSTVIPPIVADWSMLMLDTATRMDTERTKLKQLGSRLSMLINTSETGHIQPVTIGNAKRVLELAGDLRKENFAVLPIRTPTVPPGTERLRISLSARLSTNDIDRFAKTLNRLM